MSPFIAHTLVRSPVLYHLNHLKEPNPEEASDADDELSVDLGDVIFHVTKESKEKKNTDEVITQICKCTIL